MTGSLIEFSSLERLFRPRSIAVLGASSSPTKIGGRPVAALIQNGYEGDIYPVNPRSDTIQGLPAYGSITDVPGEVDLAICSVPSPAVRQVIGECADKGVGSVVVFSSGFAEVGEAGSKAQLELAGIAREAGMRMMGPNCMGMVNFGLKAVASFAPAFASELVAGRIGLVSQSGAFGGLSYILARERRQSLSFMLTTGNEADVDVGDCTAFLVDDPDTDVILLYIEGVRNGPKFIEALARARNKGKPVVAIKLGRTQAGAAAAASHTASLAGEDAIYSALFRQYGVHRVNSIEEFFDIGRACVVGHLPRNDKIALVTVSGGVGVLMADDAHERGLDVCPMPEDAQAQMLEMVPFAGPLNPIDVTGQLLNDPTLLERTMALVLEKGGYGSIISFQGSIGRNPDMSDISREGWLARKASNPGTLYAVSGFCNDDFVAAVEGQGIPVFEEPTHATRAIAALAGFARAFAATRPPPEEGRPADLPTGRLDEAQVLALLRDAGLSTPEVAVAASAQDASAAARRVGFPVVVKLLSPDVLHKSDIGGVRLDLKSEVEVQQAYDEIVAAGREAYPKADIRGCLVAPMVSGGVETILGVQRDPVFGPVVMFGLGGIFVEVLKDVTFRVAPFDVTEAHAMMREINAYPILTGQRGQAPSDVDALAEALAALSRFASANADAVESLDVNPFLVLPRGAVALDGVLVRGDQG